MSTDIKLSRREHQVLERASKGKTNYQIGTELGISMETVKSALRRAYAKLDARDRAHAVALGLKHGLIEFPDPIGAVA